LAITPPISPIRDYLTGQPVSMAVGQNETEIVDALLSIQRWYGKGTRSKYQPHVLLQEFSPSVVAKKYLKLFDNLVRLS
jgi:hypothetical protein